jgi:hypothetical protein
MLVEANAHPKFCSSVFNSACSRLSSAFLVACTWTQPFANWICKTQFKITFPFTSSSPKSLTFNFQTATFCTHFQTQSNEFGVGGARRVNLWDLTYFLQLDSVPQLNYKHNINFVLGTSVLLKTPRFESVKCLFKGKGKVVSVLNQAPRHQGVLGSGSIAPLVLWPRH